MHKGLTIDEAADLLDIVASDSDPVYRRGRETTVRELAHVMGNTSARQIWIEFHAGKACKKRRGTVYSMVLERIRAY